MDYALIIVKDPQIAEIRVLQEGYEVILQVRGSQGFAELGF